jgi:drug/metabolite transporter (DMT)-like permease
LTLMAATGALTVALLQAVRRRPLAALVRLPARVVAAGFFGVALYTVMFAVALVLAEEADIGQVNLLNYLWPIWIVLLSQALLGERRSGSVAAGALLGFAGVVLARGVDGILHPPHDWRPHLLSLAGGFLWALYCVLLRRWRIPEEQGGTALHFSVCSLLAALLATWRGEWGRLADAGPEALFWVVFGGVGPVGLGYHWWEIGMKRGNARFLGLLAYFIPVGSSLVLGALYSAALGPGLLPGALLIGLGAWVAARAEA